jgi:hypothetical protein
MNTYGETFARILTNALDHEECELRELTAKSKRSRQTVKSVKEYYESWLSVPLAKQALRESVDVPQLDWEKTRLTFGS